MYSPSSTQRHYQRSFIPSPLNHKATSKAQRTDSTDSEERGSPVAEVLGRVLGRLKIDAERKNHGGAYTASIRALSAVMNDSGLSLEDMNRLNEAMDCLQQGATSEDRGRGSKTQLRAQLKDSIKKIEGLYRESSGSPVKKG